MRKWKQTGWVAAAVGVVVMVGAVVQATPTANVTSGPAAVTFQHSSGGDSWAGFLNIDAGTDSLVRGPVLNVLANGNITTVGNPRHAVGSVSNGVNSGIWGAIQDGNSKGSYSVTLLGPDTGTGSASLGSNSFSLGETRIVSIGITFADTTCTPVRTALGAVTGANGSNLTDSGYLVLRSSDTSAHITTIDSILAVDVANVTQNADSRTFVLVFNVEQDTFLTFVELDTNCPTNGANSRWEAVVDIDTGTNYIYVVHFGETVGVNNLKDAALTAADSYGVLLGTVQIVNVTTGAVATGDFSNNNTVSATATNAVLTVSGDYNQQLTLTVQPVASTAIAVQNADSRSAESKMDTYIFDFTVFGTNGQIHDLAAASVGGTGNATVSIIVTGTDTTRVGTHGLIRINPTTLAWENVPGSSRSTSPNASSITVSATVTELPGQIFAVGTVSGASTPPAHDDDCVVNAAFGNTSLAGMMPSMRSVRDGMLGNPLGRMFVSGYYAAGSFMVLALGLGLTLAARRK